jgi:hypothetical protein
MRQRLKVVINTVLLFVVIISCNGNKTRQEVESVVQQWIGKTVLLPDDIICSFCGKDTVAQYCKDLYNKDFKILLYNDSSGCNSCKLRLFLWEKVMLEADSLYAEKLGFLFFFQPKNRHELEIILLSGGLHYPVIIDAENKIDKLNSFPQKEEYQCFLLDKNNKVLMIGNPAKNPSIWKLYKDCIDGENKNS